MKVRLVSLIVAAFGASALAEAQAQVQPYSTLTASERLKWFANSSYGLRSTGVGVFNAGFWTAFNNPHEWHGTWEGFGKRLGTRTATVSISNAAEASLGAIWGEDPRYRTDHSGTWKQRVGRAMLQGVAAQNRNGRLMPAYARYVGFAGNNFISNSWRPASENEWHNALARTGWGFSTRMVGNGFDEFWPEIQKLMRKIRR